MPSNLAHQGAKRSGPERRRLIEELLSTREELAEKEREAGMLGERARLAREIHDTVAQGLSSIQLLLHAAERADGEAPTAASPGMLARAEGAMTQAWPTMFAYQFVVKVEPT